MSSNVHHLPGAREAAKPERRRQIERDQAAERDRPLRIWYCAKAQLEGTLAATYLESLGLDLAQLPERQKALRYHPGLLNEATGKRQPALVAAVTTAGGRMIAVQCIWLPAQPDDKGNLARTTIGPTRGGAIRIAAGVAVDLSESLPGGVKVIYDIRSRLLSDTAAPPFRAIITLSVENGLIFARVCPDANVLAVADLRDLPAIILHPATDRLFIAIHGDGDTLWRSVDRMISAQHRANRRVTIVCPPDGAEHYRSLLGFAS